MLPRLTTNCVEDVQTIVYEEFGRWFGEVEAGSRESYREASVKIWEAWRFAFAPAAFLERSNDQELLRGFRQAKSLDRK